MSIKFKVGSRVKYVSGKYIDVDWNPLWGGKCGKILGTIVRISAAEDQHSMLDVYVEWDNGQSNSYKRRDLELIHNPIITSILYGM